MLGFSPALTESFLHAGTVSCTVVVSKHDQVENYWNSAAKPSKVGTVAIILFFTEAARRS